ncbi:alpha/beta hydrolase [Erwinia endophytica]|uniref:alpha/beta hydrolase n=1 Tax=Erwinia endophytica TaxID=1563158 RepID=UPI001265E3D9|nr:alpha/beta hydrolase-fold protein [Erwinia endophytica]KAB8307494.1 alpha/beta hydrolase [Erwinia endophytica]
MEQSYPIREEMIHSSVCGDYRVMICQPAAPPPDEGWPVIYLLDGASHFPIAAHLMRTLARPRCCMLPGVVVAIDYPGATRRERDYRPYVAELIPEPNPRGGYYLAGMTGAAEAFFSFLQDELKPFIRSMLLTDDKREALYGHSYGGLFTLYSLFTHSERFRHFYASSPSVWWNDGYIRKLAEHFIARATTTSLRQETVLFLSVGEHEQSLEAWERCQPAEECRWLAQHRQQRRMVDGLRELAGLFQSHPVNSLQVELFIHPDQSHQSVPLCSLQKAMMHHFRRC